MTASLLFILYYFPLFHLFRGWSSCPSIWPTFSMAPTRTSPSVPGWLLYDAQDPMSISRCQNSESPNMQHATCSQPHLSFCCRYLQSTWPPLHPGRMVKRPHVPTFHATLQTIVPVAPRRATRSSRSSRMRLHGHFSSFFSCVITDSSPFTLFFASLSPPL